MTAPQSSGTRRRRKRRARSRKKHSRRMLVATLIGLPLLVLVAGTIGVTAVFGSSCDLNALTPVAVGENSFVFAADGSELGVIPAERNRTPVSRAEISHWVPKATVAIEDRRFYQHGGIDYLGVLRAGLNNFAHGSVFGRGRRQGASPRPGRAPRSRGWPPSPGA